MDKYKLIVNFNTEKEENIYFNNMTSKKLKLMKENYIILTYNDFTQCYIVLDYKLNENDKKVFNNMTRKYCY